MKILIGLIFMILVFSSCHQGPGGYSQFYWKTYTKENLQDSVAENKPIVIDFYADWCENCHDLDKQVFSLPDIQAKLAQVTTMRMDMTNQEDPEVQKIAQEYGIEGLPTVIFLDGHGHEIPNSRVIGLVTPQEFSQALALLTIFK